MRSESGAERRFIPAEPSHEEPKKDIKKTDLRLIDGGKIAPKKKDIIRNAPREEVVDQFSPNADDNRDIWDEIRTENAQEEPAARIGKDIADTLSDPDIAQEMKDDLKKSSETLKPIDAAQQEQKDLAKLTELQDAEREVARAKLAAEKTAELKRLREESETEVHKKIADIQKMIAEDTAEDMTEHATLIPKTPMETTLSSFMPGEQEQQREDNFFTPGEPTDDMFEIKPNISTQPAKKSGFFARVGKFFTGK